MGLVEKNRRERVLNPGDILYNQGDPCEGIYCLREGLVGERRVDADGRSTLVRLYHSGHTIGYRELLSGGDYLNSMEALKDCHVCFIGGWTVRHLMSHTPLLGEEFLSRCLGDCSRLEDDLIEAKTLGVKRRFLNILMVLYERFGAEDPDQGHVVDVPVSRQDLAGLVGTAPETISRVIRQCEEDGLVYFSGQRASFPDLHLVSGKLPGRPN